MDDSVHDSRGIKVAKKLLEAVFNGPGGPVSGGRSDPNE